MKESFSAQNALHSQKEKKKYHAITGFLCLLLAPLPLHLLLPSPPHHSPSLSLSQQGGQSAALMLSDTTTAPKAHSPSSPPSAPFCKSPKWVPFLMF